MRQSRNYAALHETQHQVDEAPSPAGQPRNYDAVRETQHEVDRDIAAAETAKRPAVLRQWTHLGGMVPHHGSAHDWIKQNHEIRMSDRRDSGSGRDGPGQPEPVRGENDPELQEARAAVEEARRREAAERARQQERDRGMER